ncbi:hypothetical protein JOD55_001331 [Arcanobacterium pluranimalium]|uniref:DUF7455 domain-containing protein n=1 Tax=Arcanobacterium pluranimalium TaxID=108028 RepID=UPI001956851F|nr:hypothetical protein [Arcanobacterium pluranimalium]MBM7825504.1 hypothetical protein [Arcanobacterium pluranimalium]
MNTVLEPVVEDEKQLTALDRCDACGAQAYVVVTMPFGELMFCAHHARKHRAKIDEVATRVLDQTDQIKK